MKTSGTNTMDKVVAQIVKNHYGDDAQSPQTPPESERQRFEAWFKAHSNRPHLERAGDTYFSDWAACAWQGWQARAAAPSQPMAGEPLALLRQALSWLDVYRPVISFEAKASADRIRAALAQHGDKNG
jgi:hypothetical protein